MKKFDTIRAWTDVEYRESLTAEQLAALPANPAGIANLSDATLAGITGGGVEVQPEPESEASTIRRTFFGSRKVDCCCFPPPR